MTKVNMHEAKTHLSRLVDEAAAGKEIVIARAGKPVAKLGSFQERRPPRKKGLLKGKIHVGDAFNAPLPSEVFESLCMKEGEKSAFSWPDIIRHDKDNDLG